jgi:transposase
MPKTRIAYPPAFRRRRVELMRAGRDPESLAREFEPCAQSILNWVALSDREEGRLKGERESLGFSRGLSIVQRPARSRLLQRLLCVAHSWCFAAWIRGRDVAAIGTRVGRKRGTRLIRAAGLAGVSHS